MRTVLLVAAILVAVLWLPGPWGFAAMAAAAVIELAELALWVRLSRRRRPVTGAEALAGARGIVSSPLAPVGSVRIAGELWRARAREPLAAGEEIVVDALEADLTLVVRRASAGA